MTEKRKTEQAALEQHRPWKPPAYEPADAAAIQGLAEGNATPDQQRRALKWIIEQACGTYEMSYRPGGPEGDRDTAFAEGRRFVGSRLVFMVKLKIGMITRRNNE